MIPEVQAKVDAAAVGVAVNCTVLGEPLSTDPPAIATLMVSENGKPVVAVEDAENVKVFEDSML